MARGTLRRIGRAHVVVAFLLALTSCGDGDRTLNVFAASSLNETFAEIESAFEAGHPGIDVVVNYGGSASLAAQIDDGAPADVFAAADARTMARVVDRFDGPSMLFARNRLVIAVERDNPLGIDSLVDLAAPSVVVVLAAPEVPAGAYAAAALAAVGVRMTPASYEQSVRGVVSKVALGEADAGVVYRTDVLANGAVDGVELPDVDVTAEYPIAAVDDDGARAFRDFVLGPDGGSALAQAGFGSP